MKGVASMTGPFLGQSQMTNVSKCVGTVCLNCKGCTRLMFAGIDGTWSCLMNFIGMLGP